MVAVFPAIQKFSPIFSFAGCRWLFGPLCRYNLRLPLFRVLKGRIEKRREEKETTSGLKYLMLDSQGYCFHFKIGVLFPFFFNNFFLYTTLNKITIKNAKTNLSILTTALLVVLLHSHLTAQNWPAQDATWRYCITNWAGSPAAFVEFGVTQDTVIAGKTWHMIQQTADQHGPVIVPPDHPRTLFTRYENDTAFRWVNDQEYLFFTYNLEVGDVFTTFRSAGNGGYWNDSACSSNLPLEVIDFEMVQYGDLNLKQWTLRDTLFHDLYETAGPEEVIYVLTERIGVLNSYPLINNVEPPGGSSGGCSLPSDWGTAGIGTYSDNEIEIFFSECEGVGIGAPDETYKNELLIFQISTDLIKIRPGKTEAYHNPELRCYDYFGRQVHSQKIYKGQQDTDVDVSGWLPGIYIAVLYSDGSARGNAKFVVR